MSPGVPIPAGSPVRTVWCAADPPGVPPPLRPGDAAPCRLRPVPVGAGAAIDGSGRVHGSAHLTLQSADYGAAISGWVALVVPHGPHTYVVDLAKRAGAGAIASAVLRNGLPIAGGISLAHHGDWLTLEAATGQAAPRRHRCWLSAEGPWLPTAAGPADRRDAWTLDPIAAGDPIVRCACGAVYALATWQALRRCGRCGAVEDGTYRLLPGAPRAGAPTAAHTATGGAP